MNSPADQKIHPLVPQMPGKDQWLAVGSIAAGTFLLVTTEFLPIGLLSRLAGDLQVSEGTAGLSVTAPGLIATLAAPLLVLLAARIDRRTIITLLTMMIVLSNVIAAIAPNFSILLSARLILGLAVGGLWSFAVAVGRRLVTQDSGARATSIISAGIGLGTVCGMPAGAFIGDWIGWRSAFAINAVVGFAVLVSQLALLPRLPTAKALTARDLVAFFNVPMARVGLLASGFIAGGHFIAYTFLEPYLRDQAAFDQPMIPVALTAYAATGIAGAFVGEHLAVRGIRMALIVAASTVGIAVFLASLLGASEAAALALVMVWGAAFGAIPVCVQIWMYTSSPRLYEAGSALMVSAFQISLAAGAAIGGAIVDSTSLAAAFATSGFVTMAGVAVLLLFGNAPADDHDESTARQASA